MKEMCPGCALRRQWLSVNGAYTCALRQYSKCWCNGMLAFDGMNMTTSSNPSKRCKYFLNMSDAVKLDRMRSLDEMKVLEDLGSLDDVPKFIKWCKRNSFLEDGCGDEAMYTNAYRCMYTTGKSMPLVICGSCDEYAFSPMSNLSIMKRFLEEAHADKKDAHYAFNVFHADDIQV